MHKKKVESETLISHHITNGELLTIEESKDDTSSMTSSSQNNSTSTTTEGVLLRKVVPANNSCLFTSIHYVMSDGIYDLDCQESMRQFIAQTVRSDTINFNEAILGKTNSEYCKWIMVVNKTFIPLFFIQVFFNILFSSHRLGAAQSR